MRAEPSRPTVLPDGLCRGAGLCLLAVAIGLLTMAGAARAQYKWKDAQGRLHASDLPPPRDIPPGNVLQRPGAPRIQATASTSATAATAAATPTGAAAAARPTASAASAPRSTTDPELEARRKRAEQEAQAKAQADEARLAGQRAENCQRARQWLATLDSGQRLVRTNERGERVFVDDASRVAEADSARRVIASDCR